MLLQPRDHHGAERILGTVGSLSTRALLIDSGISNSEAFLARVAHLGPLSGRRASLQLWSLAGSLVRVLLAWCRAASSNDKQRSHSFPFVWRGLTLVSTLCRWLAALMRLASLVSCAFHDHLVLLELGVEQGLLRPLLRLSCAAFS